MRIVPFLFLAACSLDVEPDGVMAGGGGGGGGTGMQTVFYSVDIQPLFQADCITCHGGAGGLNLETYSGLIAGGVSGDAVTPGDGANSLLIRRLTGEIAPQMPENGTPYTTPEIQRIATWIDEGALDN